MMEKAVRELKGQTLTPEVEPEIRLGIPAYFPEEYIPDTNQRLLFYKRLASLEELDELESVKEELKDRYGSFTTVVDNLFLVMYLRRVLKDYLVEKLTFSEGRLVLQFHPQSPVRVERLLELMAKDHGRYRLSPDGRLTFKPQQGSWETLVQETVGLLGSLR
jgi:transcription-repair coupling factor (superfamily II helicase)